MTDHRAKRPLRATAAPAFALAWVLFLGSLGSSGPAQAQFFGGWGGWDNGGTWDGLGPQQIRHTLSERGFRILGPLRRNGSVFVVDALDQRGQRERLIVAAADAQILQRFLVDDGRGAGAAPRATDDDRGLVPPADIPDGRRYARPGDRDVPAPRFGDLGDGDDAAPPTAPSRRAVPPIRTVKPHPRVVDRAPDSPVGAREPGAVESTPLAPAAPRATAVPAAPLPAPAAKPPVPAPGPVVASRPEPAAAPAATAPAPAVAPTASRRMTDPLAIPAGDAAKPVRSVAGGITGAPSPVVPAAPSRTAPAKSGDVPVAPLD